MKRVYLPLVIAFVFATQLPAATFTVINTLDYGAGSFRWAITSANASMGPDLIDFNIPGMAPHIIQPPYDLPILTDAGTTIDGRTQPANGYTGQRRKIRIDAPSLAYGPSLEVSGAGFALFGVELRYGATAGLLLRQTASGFTVGGIGAGNTIAASSWQAGIAVERASNGIIQGNIIGAADYASLVDSNFHGIHLMGATNMTIGGMLPGEGNVISGNAGNGILIDSSSFCTILSNIIGMDTTGLAAVPNWYSGIAIETRSHDIVIGNATGGGNLISSNFYYGISIICGSNNLIRGNKMGTDINGHGNFGHGLGGMQIIFHGFDPNCPVSGNVVGGLAPGEGNIIANSQFDGLQLYGINTNHNPIRGNSFYCNNSGAINLYYGFWNYPPGNDGYSTPVISSANSTGATGTASPNDLVDLYLDDSCSNCEPKVYVATVQADQAGNWTYSGSLQGNLTAIAVHPTNGNTSDNSPCKAVAFSLAPLCNFTGPDSTCVGNCVNFQQTCTGNPTAFQWSFPGAIPSSTTDANPANICYPNPGSYPVSLIATNANGADTLEMPNFIVVSAMPTVSAGPDVAICQGDSVMLQGQTNGSFSWSPGNSLNNPNLLTPMAFPMQTTTYYLSAQSSACQALDSVVVTVNPLPTVSITQNGFVLTAITNGVSYQWYLNGSPIPGATTQSHVAAATGTYAVIVTNADGCTTTSQGLFVEVLGIPNPAPQLQMSLSPNPTSATCKVLADGLGLENATFSVMDQLGRILATMEAQPVDGKANIEISTEPLAIGVYQVILSQGGHRTTAIMAVQR